VEVKRGIPMNEPIVKVTLEIGVSLPEYKTQGSAGADLRAHFADSQNCTLQIEPGKRAIVSTGLRIQLPEGFEGQVRSRSGLALEHGVVCLNSPGTIDNDYRGELKVILANFGEKPFVVSEGDRIAQLVVAPVSHVEFSRMECLEDTKRGSGGFGSTGR
jgi:dUTP pyrophosphatase